MIGSWLKPAIEARRGAYAKPATTAVRRLRLAKGMTQPECAEFCGVSLRTFQRVDAGDTVDLYTRRRVQRALGLQW